MGLDGIALRAVARGGRAENEAIGYDNKARSVPLPVLRNPLQNQGLTCPAPARTHCCVTACGTRCPIPNTLPEGNTGHNPIWLRPDYRGLAEPAYWGVLSAAGVVAATFG